MRRLLALLGLLTVLLFTALPAFATTTTTEVDTTVVDVPTVPTTDTNAEGPTALAVLAGAATFGLIVKAVVAAVKKAVPDMQGLATMGVATLAGTLLAAMFDFQAAAALADQYNLVGVVNRVPDGAIGWLISGIAIGAASGFFAELGGTSGPRSQPARVEVVMAEEAAPSTNVNPWSDPQ